MYKRGQELVRVRRRTRHLRCPCDRRHDWGVLATASSGNANITDAGAAAKANGLARLVANGGLWVEQLKAIAITLLLAVVGTIVIAYAVKMVMGLRPSEDVEIAGLDISEHGEEGYHSGDSTGSIVSGHAPAAAMGATAPAISKAMAS